MSNSPAVQAARKKMQLARLERKGDEDYPTYYANQPFQVERARENKEYQAAQQASKNAAEALAVAKITGEGLEAAKETAAIAALVAERTKPASRGANASAGLTGA